MESSKQQAGEVDDGSLPTGTGAVSDSIPLLLKLHARHHPSQHDEETAALRLLLESDLPPHERARVLHSLADALFRLENLDEAIAYADQVLQACPEYRHPGPALRLLGTLYAERSTGEQDAGKWKQDVDAAERTLRSALAVAHDPQEQARVLVELGEVLRNDRLDEASIAFGEALALEIEEPEVLARCYHLRGLVFYEQGQMDQARQSLEESLAVYPAKPINDRACTYVDLARVLCQEGDLGRAEHCCQQAWQALDPSAPRAAAETVDSIHDVLGDLCFEKGEYQQAADYYQAVLEHSHNLHEQQFVHRKRGITLTWLGQDGDALESFRNALAIERTLPSINQEYAGLLLLLIGQCQYRLGHYTQAILTLQQASQEVSAALLPAVHLGLGHSYFSLQRYPRAADFYQQVLDKAERKSQEWKDAKKYRPWAKRGAQRMG